MGSEFIAQFSNGGVERDSLEEYELLAGEGDGNYGFISWFREKVSILLGTLEVGITCD